MRGLRRRVERLERQMARPARLHVVVVPRAADPAADQAAVAAALAPLQVDPAAGDLVVRVARFGADDGDWAGPAADAPAP